MPAADQCLIGLDLIDHLVTNEIVWIHCAKNYRVSCLMALYRNIYGNGYRLCTRAIASNLGTE
jgi:hypothetical protein